VDQERKCFVVVESHAFVGPHVGTHNLANPHLLDEVFDDRVRSQYELRKCRILLQAALNLHIALHVFAMLNVDGSRWRTGDTISTRRLGSDCSSPRRIIPVEDGDPSHFEKKVTANDIDVNRAPQNLRQWHSTQLILREKSGFS
jgi:hypothetical protein